MSIRSVAFVFLGVLAVFGFGASARSLSMTACIPEACDAVGRRDPNALQSLVDQNLVVPGCTCGGGGDTLLHHTVDNICFACVPILRANGFPIGLTDDEGNTVLHDSAAACSIEMIGNLLNQGVTSILDVENDNKLTPLCLAASQTQPNCATVSRQLVMEGKVDICRRCDEQTPKELATFQPIIDVLEQDGGCDCPPLTG